MRHLIRVLNFRLLIISAILASVSWIYGLATKMIQSPIYLHNAALSLNVYSPFCFLLLAVEVLVRHTVTKWSGKYWSNLYEILSLIIEIMTGIYYVVGITSETLNSQSDILYVLLASSYTMIVCLEVSLFCLIWDLCITRTVLKPFCILGQVPLYRSSSPRSLIFGNYLFRRRYREETTVLRMTRGTVAGIFLVAFGLVTYYALAVQPFRNHGSIPLKVFHTSARTLESQGLAYFSSWKIILQRDALALDGTQSNLLSPAAFRVQSLSKFGTGTNLKSAYPVWNDCFGPPHKAVPTLEFDCPTLYTTQPEFFNRSFGIPEILVTVNFTSLSNFFEGGYWQVVRISVGFGDSPVADILANSEPVPLLPNVYLSAGISTIFSQTFSNKNLAALGLNKYSDPKPFMKVGALFPDPAPPQVGDANAMKGVASLRLFPLLKGTPEPTYRISQESREDSVLSGFALLGGLWTFLNGAFSIIFGSTLLLILFGLKPLSIYGVAHRLQRNTASLAEGQILSAEEQARIVALLREHLLDIGETEIIDRALGLDVVRDRRRISNNPQTGFSSYTPLHQAQETDVDLQTDVPVQVQLQNTT